MTACLPNRLPAGSGSLQSASFVRHMGPGGGSRATWRSVVLALWMTAGSANAATPFPDTGGTPSITLNLGGVVPVLCTFVYTPVPAAGRLDLIGGARDGVQVATVNEWCNHRTGFRVTLTSRNKGLVREGDTSGTVWRYDIGYGGTFAASTQALVVQRAAPAFDNEVAVQMRFPAMTRAPNGNYADTLSIVVTATN